MEAPELRLVKERLHQIAAAFTKAGMDAGTAADLLKGTPFSRSHLEPALVRLSWAPAKAGAWAVTDPEGRVLGILQPPREEGEAWGVQQP
jgi:hypothetical protein